MTPAMPTTPARTRASGRLALGLASAALFAVGCPGSTARKPDAAPQAATGPDPLQGGEIVFDGGDKGDWHESGSVVHDDTGPGPARVHFGTGAEWIFTRVGLTGTFGAVVFRVKEPAGEAEFLEVGLGSTDGHAFPAVKLRPDDRSEVGEGWTQVVVPMSELNPKGAPFDRIVIRPFRPFGIDAVFFDCIGLAASGLAAQLSTLATAAGTRPTRTRVQCDAKAIKINPLIYGVAYGDKDWTKLGSPARRWGGNGSSRYNWELNVTNRSKDWFFENKPENHFDQFVAENAAQQAQSILTVPIIGWVAKDGASFSFPVSVFGAQAKTDPYTTDAGNGVTPSGANIAPGPPGADQHPGAAGVDQAMGREHSRERREERQANRLRVHPRQRADALELHAS